MNLCANCDQPIGFKTLIFSLLPLWVTCRSCRARLVGNAFVRWVTLVLSLLVAVIASFSALVIFLGTLATDDVLFVLFENTGRVAGIVTLIAIITFLAALLILWPAGTFLIWRFGKFVTASNGQGVFRGFRDYFLATGIVSVIVVTWAIIYAGYSPITIVALVSWLFIPFLVLYRFYDHRLGNRLGWAAFIVLILWSGIFNMSALIFSVYAGLNFPKEQPFEEQLVFSPGLEAQEEAWYRLIGLVNAEQPDSKQVLDFLVTNIVSAPERDANYSSQVPQVIPLLAALNSELDEIRELLAQGREKEAEERYLRLWKAVENLTASSGGLIYHLVAMGQVLGLISFQIGDESAPPLRPYAELLEISAHIGGELDRSWKNAMALEYLVKKNAMLELTESDCGLSPSRLCLFELEWPFYDGYQLLRAEHASYLSLANAAGTPGSSGDSAQSAGDSEADFDEPKISIFKNPVGSTLQVATVPLVGKFAATMLETKGRLSIFSYVMEYRMSGELGEPPIDPFTGQPFMVKDKGDTIEITSARQQRDEPAVQYEVKKLVR